MADFQNGDLEAAGAIAGMRETYGAPPTGLSIGQRGVYRPKRDTETAQAGDHINGVVIGKCESTLIIAEHVPGRGRRIHEAHADEVAAF